MERDRLESIKKGDRQLSTLQLGIFTLQMTDSLRPERDNEIICSKLKKTNTDAQTLATSKKRVTQFSGVAAPTKLQVLVSPYSMNLIILIQKL